MIQSVLISLFVTLSVIAPILSGRIIDILGFKIVLGGLFVALACSILDVINNTWGKEKARETVLNALIVRFATYGLISLAMFLPFYKEAQGFTELILTSIRLLLAAEIASVASQYFIDIPLFDYMKRKYKSFFMRYNVSNLISTAIHSVLFVMISFVGTDKAYLIPKLIVGGYVLKLGFQFLISPIFVLCSSYLVKRSQ